VFKVADPIADPFQKFSTFLKFAFQSARFGSNVRVLAQSVIQIGAAFCNDLLRIIADDCWAERAHA
jgi:hypothetical protein